MADEDDTRDTTKAERRQTAGLWLKTQRELRGWSGSDLARRLGINQVRVSAYERGQYEVPTEVAENLATVFDLAVLDVRRHLGLWVPSETDLADLRYRPDPASLTDDMLISELIRRYQMRSDREIISVYPNRSQVPRDLWERLFTSARGEITLGGYTNYFFWTEIAGFSRLLQEKAREGVQVRILVGDPEGEVTRRREAIENAALSLTTRIKITLDEVAKIGSTPNLEVRVSDVNAEAHVSRSVFRFDNEALVSEHIAEKLGHGSLTFHLRRLQEGGAFDQYVEHVEHLWSGGHPL
ncbi:MAG TPA: helix-turn-helix domain-containing protein [Streptosporangiaceae bacterium]|nr:helix-turn-helix domain-containing protein [Streptosporangiaceae bacterium]